MFSEEKPKPTHDASHFWLTRDTEETPRTVEPLLLVTFAEKRDRWLDSKVFIPAGHNLWLKQEFSAQYAFSEVMRSRFSMDQVVTPDLYWEHTNKQESYEEWKAREIKAKQEHMKRVVGNMEWGTLNWDLGQEKKKRGSDFQDALRYANEVNRAASQVQLSDYEKLGKKLAQKIERICTCGGQFAGGTHSHWCDSK